MKTDAKDLNISTISFLNDAKLLLKDDAEATLNSNITGAGFILKEGTGTVKLSGTNDYTGTTGI